MKKLTSLFLAILLVLSVLVSCSPAAPADTGTEKETETGKTVDSGTETENKDPEQPVDDLPQNVVLYVKQGGGENAAGTEADPFPSVQSARDFIRTLDKSKHTSITVHVAQGVYECRDSLYFSEEDSGTETCPIKYVADGEVEFNGGMSFEGKDFASVADSEVLPDRTVLDRLSEGAKDRVRFIDLTAYGLSAADWGIIAPIGLYSTSLFYPDSGYGHVPICLYYNGIRMNLARYPNEGWLKNGTIVRVGETAAENNGGWTNGAQWTPDGYYPDAPIVKVAEDEAAAKIASWATLDDVWMYGLWRFDWAPSSTPVAAYNPETRELTHKFASWYGIEQNTKYYFFNVLEELDAPGEWYLDRSKGILYVYADDDFETAAIDLSLYRGWMLHCANASYLTFDGFTIANTVETAVRVRECSNITLQNLVVREGGKGGIQVTDAENCNVLNCDLSRIATFGIQVTGGDIESLTPSGCRVYNNLVHDWSEVDLADGIAIRGCGITVSHNELYNTPGQAITFSGPNNLIEYNELHHVCLRTIDGGAIYGGRNFYSYGTVIQYNYIHDIGSDGFPPQGIYMDDGLSGITVFGNLLTDIPDWDILIGGGRDMVVENNIMVYLAPVYDPGRHWESFHYDQRGYDGLFEGNDYSWFDDSTLWNTLYTNEAWTSAFPAVGLIEKYTLTDGVLGNLDGNKYCGVNPGCSVVQKNVATGWGGNTIIEIMDKVLEYSEVEDIIIVNLNSDMFQDWENGDFTLKKLAMKKYGLKDIHFKDMGRVE